MVFVNGLPVGLIELKVPGQEGATLRGAWNQLRTYAQQIPALVAFTETGASARRLAKYRSPIPLLAFTPTPSVRSQLALSWGIETFLVPSVTHVFSSGQHLYLYFEVYDPARTDEAASVAASLTFLRGRSKILESAPLRLTQPLPNRPNTLAFHFTVPLKKLQPGRYTCQVNVIDELGRKFAFRRAGMVVLR